MSAHAFKNGVLLPNDGISTFEARSGVYAVHGQGRANWSFDFAYSVSTAACSTCRAFLRIDTGPSALWPTWSIST